MRNYAGVWMDSRSALILKMKDGVECEIHVSVTLDSKHVKGGARSSTPYGPQDVVLDSKVMERRKHQTSQYYRKIRDKIKDAKEVLLIGPGESKNKLHKEMTHDYNFKGSLVVTENSDKMTVNQIKARLRKFFK